MLILDQDFKEAFDNYYSNVHPFEVPKRVEAFLIEHLSHIYTDIVNIFRAVSSIGQTYSYCYEEILKRLSFKLPMGVDVNLIVFNVVFFQLFHSNLKALDDFLGVRFKTRNFRAEIAMNLYGVADEESIAKLNRPQRHYTVEKPTPISRDQWFYNMCLEVAANSKCHSRKIGALLVRDKSIISTGYNGPPRGVPTCDKRWTIDKQFAEKYADAYREFLEKNVTTDGICPRRVIGFPSGQGLEICPAGHAERNALINAARDGIKTKGTMDEPTTLYMSCGVPCSPCLVEIINAGVSEIVITEVSIYDATSEYLLENSNLKIRLFDFLKN